MFEADKVMFEVYRDSFAGKYRVVYFTELHEHNKEWEINRALSGDHFYDGFISNNGKERAKETIQALLKRLNEGEAISPQQFEAEISDYIPA